LGLRLRVRWKQKAEIALENPVLLVGFPDVGFVGKQAVDYLVSQVKPVLLYEAYSPHFPPQIIISRDGLIEVLRCQLYGWKNPGEGRSLLIFTGNAQPVSPEGQHVMAMELLSLAEKYGVKEVYSLTGHLVEYRPPEKEPTVYAAATSPDLLNKLKGFFGISVLEKGRIEGLQGLVLAEAKIKGLQAACLMAETPGYSTPSGRPLVDAKASRVLLQILNSLLGLNIDLSGLERQVALTEEFMEKLAELEQKVLEQVLRPGKPPEKEKQYYV